LKILLEVKNNILKVLYRKMTEIYDFDFDNCFSNNKFKNYNGLDEIKVYNNSTKSLKQMPK
jgi:hypothetical protein